MNENTMIFIEWCNNNEGFINALLGIVTIMFTLVAIIVSFKVAYIPFKKRIIINPILDYKGEGYILTLVIANLGNRLIGINTIIANYKEIYIGATDRQVFIEPSKTQEFIMTLDLNEKNVKFDSNPTIKIIIEDTERRKYTFKTNLALG